MVWIQTSADVSIEIGAELEPTFALICDIPVAGPMTPGVVRIDDEGDGRYRWVMSPRRGVGTTFTPDYVCEYRNNGRDEMTFETVSGNLKTRGRWRLSPAGKGRTRVSVNMTTELDAPVPRLMKKPAEVFARREARSNLEEQLERIKKKLERGS